MRVAVATCIAYRDAWEPFLKLFQKFWPTCPYEVLLITDRQRPGKSWCSVVGDFAQSQKAPVLLMQEDFFLNEPVDEAVIEHGMRLVESGKAGMVRLYPCPGGDVECGDPYFKEVVKGTRYRVSCQASIWNPRVLEEIASHCNTPAEFELDGTPLSSAFDEPFLAFNRDLKKWPMSYYCSAISRGKWEPAAVEFCLNNGIEIDLTMRGIAT